MPTKKPRGYPLTPELLSKYRDAALANADDLIIEAGTLLQSGHHARAYFLAVAAIEEIGKAVQAAQGLARNLSDAAVRTKLQIQFEDHSNKVTSAFIPWMLTKPDLRSEVMDFVSTAIDIKQGREPSMYVDINPASLSVVIPKVAVRPVAASNSVALAQAVLANARPYVEGAALQSYTRDEDTFFALPNATFLKMARTEDFWEYYLSRMEAGDKALANAVVEYHRVYFTKNIQFKPTPRSDGNA